MFSGSVLQEVLDLLDEIHGFQEVLVDPARYAIWHAAQERDALSLLKKEVQEIRGRRQMSMRQLERSSGYGYIEAPESLPLQSVVTWPSSEPGCELVARWCGRG